MRVLTPGRGTIPFTRDFVDERQVSTIHELDLPTIPSTITRNPPKAAFAHNVSALGSSHDPNAGT